MVIEKDVVENFSSIWLSVEELLHVVGSSDNISKWQGMTITKMYKYFLYRDFNLDVKR